MTSESFSGWIDEHSSALIGLPPDQANFILSQLVSVPLSLILQLALPASSVGPSVRHAYCLSIGITLTILCFRGQILNVLIPSSLLYLLLVRFPSHRNLGASVVVGAMAYLSACHIYRQYTDYGGYKLDITGPLMIMTQKVSTLAFAITDGHKPGSEIGFEEHSRHRVSRVPSPLAYFSFLFGFLGFQTGPGFFFDDYESFIQGTSISTFTAKAPGGREIVKRPSPVTMMAKNAVATVVCMLVVSFVCPHFPVEGTLDSSFFARGFLSKLLYIYVATTLYRFRYYLAWKLGETVCNAAGFGFSGWTPEGEQKWDLVKNGSMFKLETATSFKVVFDSWNTQTSLWLRYICYTRVAKRHATNATFALSCMWHGFYPGYYITFTQGMLFVALGRKLRRNVRPLFQGSGVLRVVYWLITLAGTHLALSFAVTAHILLRVSLVARVYWSLYFYVIVVALLLQFTPWMRYLPKPAAKSQ